MAERVATENNLEVIFEPAPYNVARWVSADDRAKLEAFLDKSRASMAKDLDGAPVYLAKNTWDVGYVQEQEPGHPLHQDERAGVAGLDAPNARSIIPGDALGGRHDCKANDFGGRNCTRNT